MCLCTSQKEAAQRCWTSILLPGILLQVLSCCFASTYCPLPSSVVLNFSWAKTALFIFPTYSYNYTHFSPTVLFFFFQPHPLKFLLVHSLNKSFLNWILHLSPVSHTFMVAFLCLEILVSVCQPFGQSTPNRSPVHERVDSSKILDVWREKVSLPYSNTVIDLLQCSIAVLLLINLCRVPAPT